MPSTAPPEIFQALRDGDGPPAGLDGRGTRAFERLDLFFTHGLGYAQEMGHRPQTLYGIADSPVGLAAWFLDHDQLELPDDRPRVRRRAGRPDARRLLDNITIAWLTNTAFRGRGSIGRRSREPRRSASRRTTSFFEPIGRKVPVAVSVFPDELYPVPESWAERTYPKLIHYNRLPKGGHFAAWEQPEFLVAGAARRLPVAALSPTAGGVERRRLHPRSSALLKATDRTRRRPHGRHDHVQFDLTPPSDVQRHELETDLTEQERHVAPRAWDGSALLRRVPR